MPRDDCPTNFLSRHCILVSTRRKGHGKWSWQYGRVLIERNPKNHFYSVTVDSKCYDVKQGNRNLMLRIHGSNSAKRISANKWWFAYEGADRAGIPFVASSFGALINLLSTPEKLPISKGTDILSHPLTVGHYGARNGG